MKTKVTSTGTRFSPPTLIRLRLDAGLTQEQLAVKAGISVAALSRLELGKTKPRAKTWKKLLGVLQNG
jgi:transcriptional regulator with XRE-family HTH domain